MTPQKLDRVAPGRATDARVARLIGWTHVGQWRGEEPVGRDEWVGVPPDGIEEFRRGDRDRAVAWLPPFSTDADAAAHLQRDALRRFGLHCTLAHDPDAGEGAGAERCVLDGSSGQHVEAIAPTGQKALAICAAIIAALSAAGTMLG